FDRGPSESAPVSSDDSWHQVKGGARVDGTVRGKFDLQVEGDVLSGTANQLWQENSFTPPYSTLQPAAQLLQAQDFLVRSTEKTAAAETSVQFFTNHSRLGSGIGVMENESMYDLSFQQHRHVGTRQELVWGLGYRYDSYATSGSTNVWWNPANDAIHIASGFIQDELRLAGDRVRLTAGTKIEHDGYGGWAPQPNLRALVKVSNRNSLWTSYAIADRIPSPNDTALQILIPLGPVAPGVLGVAHVFGTPSGPEIVHATEAGYRFRPTSNSWIDAAAFYNSYSHVMASDTSDAPNMQGGMLVFPEPLENLLRGKTKGIEFSGVYQPVERLRLRTAYSYIHFSFTAVDAGAHTVWPDYSLANLAPAHQAYGSADLRLVHGLELNSDVRFVDRLNIGVPAYQQIDSSLMWKALPRLSLSANAENLLDRKHREFTSSEWIQAAVFGRSIYGKVTWRF
ncbi:MAG TPA: TonB-dependent receptor, partial [Terriglobales bacterium]|nr:TonB-dependent receptor [Terriglobales bacterium]